ncbi:MAG: hypothetical protein US60_C0015G0055 [Microgenomates group bacterium GW2011_GWC1_37_8]|uniref:Antitoxin n=1 Tax=Candidatus Woesebacteria bacterium GW2011_GWB1_38_8 TaxID=1618570 RepID=A0A0G0NJP1_9BACT|nr:MAG: hypothetical protein US60_C0015G0055 [Microgenomates group bacterium GW2011_GWC1_37_8]KKQ86094.1 MAG: hypothetical protein UT08_C0002G0116 [Candidatus Woesebacteria bacterium GW2011_GWB1_38_8]
MPTIISITKARENLPKLAEEVYFKGKTFIIEKRGIPMAKIIKADKSTTKLKGRRKDIEKAIKMAGEIKGIWNDKKWKNKSSVEIANYLRQKTQNSHAS